MSIETFPTNAERPDRNSFESQEIENLKKQRNKVVGSLLYNNSDIMFQEDCDVSNEDRNKVIQKYIDGEVSPQAEVDILRKVPGPMELYNTEIVRQGLSQSKKMRRIIGYNLHGLEGFNAAKTQNLSMLDLVTFYGKYPTPADFQGSSEAFLNLIKTNNPEQKYAEYKEEMQNFKSSLYGERNDCWNEILSMKKTADYIKNGLEMDKLGMDKGSILFEDERRRQKIGISALLGFKKDDSGIA